METGEEGQNQPRIHSNRINLLEIVEDEEEERISALPNSLLLEILSRLPSTKEAISSGTLSKRWKHLWTLVPNLIFNDHGDNPLWPDTIDKTLTQCRQLKLKRFVVYTNYDIQLESKVNNWIRFAVTRNVEELSLMLDVKSVTEFPLDQNVFISSCITNLTLEGCTLNPTGAISWKNLRSLYIFDGKLDEDLIENILSGSPVLETLGLHRCYGYRLLNITSKSVKKLVFYSYEAYIFADIVEINAPNLLSLTISGQLLLWKLLLLNVSSLVEVELDYQKMGYWETRRTLEEEEMLKGFILNLRHVNKLKIGSLCIRALSRLEAKGFKFPSNVEFPNKYLELLEEGDWSYSDSDESQDYESVESEEDL